VATLPDGTAGVTMMLRMMYRIVNDLFANMVHELVAIDYP
jgi:hypothetical protein